MKKYRLNVVSQTNIIVLIILLAISFISIAAIDNKPHPVGLSLLITGSFLLAGILLWRKFVTGITEWTIDEQGVNIKWIKKFYMANNSDISLKWDEIKKLKIGCDPNYFTFVIILVNEEKLKFFHDAGFFKKDDLNEINKEFQEKMNWLKQKGK